MPIDKTLGYEYIYDPTHPLSNKAGKVYVHRIVASEKMGRWLETWEHVHHIDGIKNNNHPDNLQILSASEHTTEEQRLRGYVRKYVNCSICGTETSNLEYCSSICQGKGVRRFETSKEELESLLSIYPMTKIGEMFGVSDNAIRRRAKLLGVDFSKYKFAKPRPRRK